MSTESLSPLYFAEDRYIGYVSQLGPMLVEVELETAQEAMSKGGPRVSVGAHVIISSSEHVILGQIIRVTLRELSSGGPRAESISARLAKGGPIAVVQLLNTITVSSGAVSRGVVVSPRLGDLAFTAHPEIVKRVAETRSVRDEGEEAVSFHFASLPDEDRTPIRFTPEMVFGRHCAILGASGGGKSFSVARLAEEAARFNSKVVIIDATGEYSTLVNGALHAHIGCHPNPAEYSMEVVLPYFQLMESDLFAIFRPTGQSQAPKLRAAIKSLKLLQLEPSLGVDGIIIKANRAKQHYESEYSRFFSELEKPDASFDITRLIRQIQNECVNPNRSSTEPQYWGDLNSIEQAHCVPLINRIQDILNSDNLAPIFHPAEKPSLLEVIDRFLDHAPAKVLVVSFQYLSFAHHAREIIANTVGRYLLKKAREQLFKEKPIVVFIDEAHQFFDRSADNKEEAYPLDSFGIIAKEGRKYGLTLAISTQRPREIPEAILSQFGTLIVHRLINDRDRAVVERASGEIDRSVLDSLPGLAPGQAVVLGIDFPVPLLVRVERPQCEPDSRGPNYQKFWL